MVAALCVGLKPAQVPVYSRWVTIAVSLSGGLLPHEDAPATSRIDQHTYCRGWRTCAASWRHTVPAPLGRAHFRLAARLSRAPTHMRHAPRIVAPQRYGGANHARAGEPVAPPCPTTCVCVVSTCIYLALQRQSPVVIFAFLLIALERRAQERFRRRGSGNPADSQPSSEPADRFARDVVDAGWSARRARVR